MLKIASVEAELTHGGAEGAIPAEVHNTRGTQKTALGGLQGPTVHGGGLGPTEPATESGPTHHRWDLPGAGTYA